MPMAEYCNCAGPMDVYNSVCGTCLKKIDNFRKPQNYHIIGKVYDVDAKNMNKIIAELDAKNTYIERLEEALASNVCGYCWEKINETTSK
jgi:hypothetical protein